MWFLHKQDPRTVHQRFRRRLGCWGSGFTAAAQKEDLGSLSVSEKRGEQREGLQQHSAADKRYGSLFSLRDEAWG